MLSKANQSEPNQICPYICENDFDSSCQWLAIPLHIKVRAATFTKACEQSNKVLAEFVELVESFDQDNANTWLLTGDQSFNEFVGKADFLFEDGDYISETTQFAIIKFGQSRNFNSKQMHLAQVLDAMFAKAKKYQNDKGNKVIVGDKSMYGVRRK